MSSILETIESIDKQLFLFFNSHHSPFFDAFFSIVSFKFTWLPVYVLFLILLIKNYKEKSVWYILGAILTVSLSDLISVNLFKEVFQRYRPCHNLQIKEMVHIVNNHCGGKYGFVSSHAANTFAIAVFMIKVLPVRKFDVYLLVFWAILVSYSRIYLGVHYPADVVVGALLGSAIALLVHYLLTKLMSSKLKT